MLGLIAAGLGLAGCAVSPAVSVPVPVHINAVNFTNRTVLYLLFDPANPDPDLAFIRRSSAAFQGRVLSASSVPEERCCYEVPSRWTPGTQVGVEFVMYDEHGQNPVRQVSHVDLPPYGAGDKAGDLWIMFHTDQTVRVVSTVHRPYADAWPGLPISLDFQRKLWERDLARVQMDVNIAHAFITAFERNPEAELVKNWQMYLELNAENPGEFKEPSLFSGPQDPAFLVHVRAKDQRVLARATQRLDRLLKIKP